MGRHSSDEDGAAQDALDAEGAPERSREADEFWDLVGVDPVEIAFSKGVGLTLRAYLPVAEDVEDEAEEDAEAEEEETPAAKKDGKKKPAASDDDEDDESGSDDEEEDDEEEEEPELTAPVSELTDADIDEAPRFLTSGGKLLLFDNAADLVAYVKENRDHDLAELDTWDDVVGKIKTEWVVATDEDSYELDLVVENLRGGHDAWDHELIISAGELARDLAYALQLKSVLTALAPGSPIDDLDEALRSVDGGGLSGFFAKRRLRKIGAQQASLAWRSIIGKLSAASDWRK
ncbi:hypothetical protein Afil01_58340 [Actinorhabdospora filicis]|uniref:Uncharacterized protein n=1 Tax=Actinorhabdospora filicis TaxID=1785913 RepID=A0A9W6SRQ4_9ACTN|nr:DNA primase [Actinorhabdospora filicis]GLZ81027.1 hypothetical protein Afil01_58340 [Actinorhabdospora filicis]